MHIKKLFHKNGFWYEVPKNRVCEVFKKKYDNMLSDNIMLSDDIMLSDNMLSDNII
jgi:hypothetical protein